jgi:hypothetical protein
MQRDGPLEADSRRFDGYLRIAAASLLVALLMGLAESSWLAAVSFMGVAVVGAVAGTRLCSVRRWREGIDRRLLLGRARQVRGEHMLRIASDQRLDLQELEGLVAALRRRSDQDDAPIPEPLLARLDALLLLFVELSQQLRVLDRGLARTSLRRPAVVWAKDAANEEIEAERQRQRHFARLRVRARYACRERRDLLATQLGSIAELVCLVYEQSILPGTESTELTTAMDLMMEDAELLRQAGTEAGALMAA